MVGHQVVVGLEEESDLPYYASMAAHCSFVPEWTDEGIVSSGVSHQLLNQCKMEDEEDVLKQNVPAKWGEKPSIENHLERGVREAEVIKIRKEAEIDPRRSQIEPASSSALPKSPVGTNSSDDEKDSFENFINESKQTYHERVAGDYKSTIKRIQDLHKVVEEEIGEFEKLRKDVRKSEVINITSNVRGVSFPLEITINQKGQKEDSPLVTECQKEEVEEAKEESENKGEGANIISATCTLRENTPILITTTNRDQVECDSGFEGSPDLNLKTEDVRSLQVSLTDRESESPVSFPRQTLTTP